MNYDSTPKSLPAPCIIESGIVVHKQDIYKLLSDLRKVKYYYILNDQIENEGEVLIKEVFIDSQRSTLVANHSLYLNLESFDYLRLVQSPQQETYFELIQDNRQLRLVPVGAQEELPHNSALDTATLEAMLTQVLSARWDVQLDDEDYSF